MALTTKSLSPTQALQQFAVNSSKTAIAKDADDFAAERALRNVGHDGIDVRQISSVLSCASEVEHQFFGVKPFFRREQFQASHLRDDDRIGIGKGAGQLVLENVAASCIGARFENGPDFLLRIFDAQGAQGLADSSGVVAEIVEDGDAAGDAADFHAAFDAFESVKGGLDLMVLEAAMFGASNDGEGVANVEFANEVDVEFETRDFEFGGCGSVTHVEGSNGIGFTEAESFDRTMGDVEQRGEIGVVAVGEKQAIARDEADEMFERGLDGIDILEDIRVVKFEIVDDGDFGKVMNEFAALVEKSGVVFVAFDDEPFAISEARALAEIVRNAANEIAWIQSVVFEEPGEK